MKAILKNLVRNVLARLAKRKLAQIQPKIIGITGSVGKTSAKEAIVSVLERRYKVVKSEKNFNTDFGVILTILGQPSGYSSLSKWLKILFRSLKEAMKTPEPYDVLVMEMGVDKPGDMNEILKVITPDVMIFLNVKNVHRAEGQFANKEAIFEEKSRAVLAVPKGGWAILNTDDNFVKQLADKLPAESIKIGTGKGCDLSAKDIETTKDGLKFKLHYENKEVPVHLPHVLGDCHVTMALAAIASGFILELPWKTIEAGLRDFHLPPGRMNLIPGKNHSCLIDSSYNASPDTMEEGLKVLDLFPGRKIAALGSMNELGELAESAHIKVGKMAAEYADLLVAVGKHAKELAEGAHRAGMSASMIHSFRTSKEAGQFLSELVEKGDVVMAKGSQNKVRMEHVIKACMRDPEKARRLLVRQEPYWMTHL